jgi:hypothetical protein
MHTTDSYAAATELLRHHTGVIIPVYFPKGDQPGEAADYLDGTVRAYCAQVPPSAVCLSVDGAPHGDRVATALARRHGTQVVVGPVNRGKFAAAANGMRALFAQPELRYFAIVDQDGDHFANELLNFVRAAVHAERCSGPMGALVLGRRISRHHPMGFPRGELEELADRVLLDALHYHAAITGRPLPLELATTLEEFPDFHSGYKLLSGAAARAVFGQDPPLAGCTERCAFYHAVEAVITVEALLAEARLVVVNRTTLNEQPHTTFGLMHRQQLMADKVIWPCRRLGVPPVFVRQFVDNHLPRLRLGTLCPDGQQELLEVRRRILTDFGLPADATALLRPLFL